MRKKIKMMVVLIMATAMTMGTTSCETQAEKEAKANQENEIDQPTKYRIEVSDVIFRIDVCAFECDAVGDRIYENDVTFTTKGATTKTFTAQPEAKKLKLYMVYDYSFGKAEGWVQIAYPLKQGETTVIRLDGHTSLGRNMP